MNNIIDIDNNDITNDGNTEEISSSSNLSLMSVVHYITTNINNRGMKFIKVKFDHDELYNE